MDVTEDFLVKAKTYLGEEGKRVRNYFCCGLQDFSPEPSSYDVIWIQWVIGEHPPRVPASYVPPAVETGAPPGSWSQCSCSGRASGAPPVPAVLPGPWDTT